MNEYNDMLQEMIDKLSPLEKAWFEAVDELQRIGWQAIGCPWWRFFERRRIYREFVRQSNHCDWLRAQVEKHEIKSSA